MCTWVEAQDLANEQNHRGSRVCWPAGPWGERGFIGGGNIACRLEGSWPPTKAGAERT